VLLSLAAGVPVVAAPGGGLEELVRRAGQSEPGLVFAGDGSEWADHLTRLLADRDERARRSAAARALIDQQIWADVQYPKFKKAVLG
jgi:glycosyltransferase involved in cell wall biosynthesis